MSNNKPLQIEEIDFIDSCKIDFIRNQISFNIVEPSENGCIFEQLICELQLEKNEDKKNARARKTKRTKRK